MMTQQAQANATCEQGDVGASLDGGGPSDFRPAGSGDSSGLQAQQPQPQSPPQQLQQQQQFVKSLAEDDVLPRLEAMVEDLAGASSFTLVEDVEDACSKVQAAHEALIKVREVLVDSGLRHSAPSFVPGQMWTGRQRSSFVD